MKKYKYIFKRLNIRRMSKNLFITVIIFTNVFWVNNVRISAFYDKNYHERLEQNYINYVKNTDKIYSRDSTLVTKTVPNEEIDVAIEEKNDEECNEYISVDSVSGTIYSYDSLCDMEFLKKNFYTITSITSLNSENFDPVDALNRDLSIDKDVDGPQILIFHSHASEAFVDSIPGDTSTNIVGVGDLLAKILTVKYGYKVVHDTTTFDMLDARLDRGKAYNYANAAVDEWLNEYPSIQVVLDVHRDGISDDMKLVSEVNGKPTAQVMFFNGISYTNENGFIEYLRNPYLAGNLAMSLQMQLMAKAYYPEFARRVYIQGYRYSEHHADRSMLIEVGAQTNTVEEVMNAMEPLADLLDKVLSGKRAYTVGEN